MLGCPQCKCSKVRVVIMRKVWCCVCAQYPHLVKKATPVTSLMINDALDNVEAVQLGLLALTDGEWLLHVPLDRLRNAAWLLTLGMVGRRAGGWCCWAECGQVGRSRPRCGYTGGQGSGPLFSGVAAAIKVGTNAGVRWTQQLARPVLFMVGNNNCLLATPVHSVCSGCCRACHYEATVAAELLTCGGWWRALWHLPAHAACDGQRCCAGTAGLALHVTAV